LKTYSYADLTLSSTEPLPELCEPDGPVETTPQILFKVEDVPRAERAPQSWDHLGHPITGDILLSVARTDAGFVLSFPSLADFVISEAGDRVTARPGPNCSPETLRHVLLDQVLPRVIAHSGRLVLHASAVEIGGLAVAFVGPSGIGKSTLAASLHGAGFPSLADDGLILTGGKAGWTAHGLYPGFRLWPSSVEVLVSEVKDETSTVQHSAKRRIRLPGLHASSGLHLGALFFLAEPPSVDSDQRVIVSHPSQRDACMEIIRSSFFLDVSDTQRAADLLQIAAEVVKELPTIALTYPRDFSRLPEIYEIILRHLQRCGGSSERTQTTNAGLP
jgi:energy-coupling factor transporter ATP-binding protein EcfA2